MRSSDDVGDQPCAQLLDLVLEDELALLEAAQLQLLLSRVAGEPADHGVEVVVLDLELLETDADLHLLLVGQSEVRHSTRAPERIFRTGRFRPRDKLHGRRLPLRASYPYTWSGGRGLRRSWRAPRENNNYMRRSDYDVTDSIRTTDPAGVGAEVVRIFNGLYGDAPTQPLERAFADAAAFYRGEHPDYHACDTEYHDIQHVLDVTLAMARLLDGYERQRNGGARLAHEVFTAGVLAALFPHFCFPAPPPDPRHPPPPPKPLKPLSPRAHRPGCHPHAARTR